MFSLGIEQENSSERCKNKKKEKFKNNKLKSKDQGLIKGAAKVKTEGLNIKSYQPLQKL